jgi:two-component system, NtrC family, nitrogen regulation response regulator NtrX
MASRERPRILVVDDDSAIRVTFARILEGEGYDVVPARDGLEALRLAASHWHDAVPLDLFMPEMDGLTALRHLRELAPDAAVVILSAHIEPERRDEALRLGAAAVLAKPPDLEELLSFFHEHTRPSESPA